MVAVDANVLVYATDADSPFHDAGRAWIVLVPTERHADGAAQVVGELPHLALAGNLWYDTHTAVLMRERGIRRIVTRDTDFHHFPFIERIDPLA